MDIYEYKNYGKIKIDLKSAMEKKNISRNKLAKLIGSDNNVIKRYYNDILYEIDLDILARLCYVLECEPEDIIKYEK